ncbi:MAG TPA: DUF2092 domain-containing protein [Phycisphaerae bacterium]|nr:DUF2092 domain-containing protein [Phycisphaerae bacterium]
MSGFARTCGFILMLGWWLFGADTSPAAPEQEKAVTSTASAPAVERQVDPAADRLLRAWSETLRSARRFQVDVRLSVRIQSSADSTQLSSSYLLAAEHPNKLAILPQKTASDPMLVCDGKQLYAFLPLLNRYSVGPAPAGWDQLRATDASTALLAGGSGLIHLLHLLAADPYEELVAIGAQITDLGTEDIDGSRSHRVRVAQHHLLTDVWIQDGPQPVIRRMMPSLAGPPGSATAPAGPEAARPARAPILLESTLTFSDWRLDSPLPVSTFEFIPPPQAQRVEQLLPGTQRRDRHPLVGQPAPAFRVDLLDGGSFDLASVKGLKVVVLDFWASWSGGSAERLPLHNRLAQAYTGLPVEFIALNIEDMERFARSFLRSNNIGLPVAIEADEAVAKLYKVQKLPQTFLIDAAGIVRAAYEPFPANVQNTLRAELDRVLKAKPLPGAGAVSTTSPARDAAKNQQPQADRKP